MRFYLLDFQHIGADFVPLQPLQMNPKKFIAYGVLLYRGNEIKVKISVEKFGAPMIKAIALSNNPGDSSASKEAYDNYCKMKAFYKDAISNNINGLRNRVFLRRIGVSLYMMTQLFFIICMTLSLQYFFVTHTVLSLFLLFSSLILSRILYVRKWKYIPFGKEYRNVGDE